MKTTVFIVFALLCGTYSQAKVALFEYQDYKIYSLQDAPNQFPASLFFSVDQQEPFVQTAETYSGSVNVFVIEYKRDGRRIMVDSGFGEPKGQLLSAMKESDIAPESISDIIVSHIHPDHVGGLNNFPRAKIHVSREEFDAWENDASRSNLSKHLQETGHNLILFQYGTEIVPRLKAIKASGHTPGHTVFQLGNCYFVGDIIHAADLQLAHPSFCARFDMDPHTASNTRKKAIKEFHGDWFGAHIPFPGKYANQK